MHKRSFLAGLLTGALLAILAVLAVPGLRGARKGGSAGERAPRTSVVVLPDELRLPPAPAPEPPPATAPAEEPAVEPKATDAAAAAANEAEREAVRSSQETAAMATLRNVISAQAQFQSTARADENRNGVGEYGSFAELSGATGVRDGEVLNPPVLSRAFRLVSKGRAERNGYRYRIYLPGAGGLPVTERDKGGIGAGEVDPALAETTWCVYAWPVEGEGRTFFTNQAGDVLATSEGGYVGDREPQPYAAFRDASGLLAPTAIATEGERHVGADRCEWKQLN